MQKHKEEHQPDSYASASIYCPLFRYIKNFADFQVQNNLRKMLTICNKDSQTRNAIRCGITAKVRRKNEYAREMRSFFPNIGVFYTKGAGLEDKKPIFSGKGCDLSSRLCRPYQTKGTCFSYDKNTFMGHRNRAARHLSMTCGLN